MPLPHPWIGNGWRVGFPLTAHQELIMAKISNTIREKPNWWLKCQDLEISIRWRQEIEAIIAADELWSVDLGQPEIDFIFKELEWYAQKRQDQVDQGAEVTIDMGVEATRRADGLVPETLKERLLECVKKLEDVPEHLKDWHPGSRRQVLDLVHPSLFPFVAGRTLVTKEEALPPLKSIGSGEAMDKAPFPAKVDKKFCSEKFQWLPTDFDVSSEGRVKAKSYINNLHPEEHKEMYPVLEEILEKFLPMFEEVLGELAVFVEREKKLTVNPNWYEPPLESDLNDRYAMEDYYNYRQPIPIAIPDFSPRPDVPKYDLKNTGKPLQVIIKLANIELTPKNPIYQGGTWHVEGMANENIVATGIYYYHTENITESRLDFRIQVQEPMYQQGDRLGVGTMYYLWDGYPLAQDLDGVITKRDRCLVFPNIYQHQVQPFKLADATKPGSRKILVFFLVNPEEPVLSTTHVPPQQREWVRRNAFERAVQEKLPTELVDEIYSLVNCPMDLEEAKKLRVELMKERKFFVKSTIDNIMARPFSLCEH